MKFVIHRISRDEIIVEAKDQFEARELACQADNKWFSLCDTRWEVWPARADDEGKEVYEH